MLIFSFIFYTRCVGCHTIDYANLVIHLCLISFPPKPLNPVIFSTRQANYQDGEVEEDGDGDDEEGDEEDEDRKDGYGWI